MAIEEWDPLSKPGHYISRISRSLTRIGDVRLRDLGFATGQLPVLAALKDGRRMSQAELARWAKVEQPSMAQLLNRMERDGLIGREPDPADRRSSLVHLTDKAQQRLPAGQAVLRQGNDEMTQGMSPEEVALLVSLLGRLLENVEEMEKKTVVSRK